MIVYDFRSTQIRIEDNGKSGPFFNQEMAIPNLIFSTQTEDNGNPHPFSNEKWQIGSLSSFPSNTIIWDWKQKYIHALTGKEKIIGHINGLEIRLPKIYSSVFQFVETLSESTTLLYERDVESYIKGNREKFFQLCEEKGYTLKGVNPNITAAYRKKFIHIDKKKWTKKKRREILVDIPEHLREQIDDNVIDVNVLFFMVRKGVYFAIPTPHKDEKTMENIKKINYELMILRATETRNEYITFIDKLPDPNDLEKYADPQGTVRSNGRCAKFKPCFLQNSLCKKVVDTKGNLKEWIWDENVIATVAKIVEIDSGCKRFDFYTGHYGGNHPSMAASEIKHWGWPNAVKNGATKQEYKQAIRWLFKTLKN